MKHLKAFFLALLAVAVDLFSEFSVKFGGFSPFGLSIGLRGDQVKLYVKDMYKAEREGYKECPTRYDQVFKVVRGVSGAGTREDQFLGAGSLTRHEVENQKIRFKSPVPGWSYYSRYWMFSDGLFFSKEAVDDTVKLGNLLKELAKTWGRSVRVQKETLAARVFNKGGETAGDWVFNGTHTGQTDASGNLLYDSKPLFNLTGNTRSTKGGGTYYNSVANLTLTPESFEAVYNLATVTNAKDERDREIEIMVDTLLVRSGAERFKAERILETTTGMPNGQLNDKNVYYGIVKPMDWRYLNDGTSYPAFYVGKKQSDSFQFHERQMPEIRFFVDEHDLSKYASINLRFGTLLKDFRTWNRGGGTSA